MGIVKLRPVEILPKYDTIGITGANTKLDESREHYSVYSNRAPSTSESSDEEESPALQLSHLFVKVYHLFCASDVYRGDNHSYAGFILYLMMARLNGTSTGRNARLVSRTQNLQE